SRTSETSWRVRSGRCQRIHLCLTDAQRSPGIVLAAAPGSVSVLAPRPRRSAMDATPSQRTGVHDEISPLRRVIVHAPGPELERLTPDTREQLLFDEVLWRDRAQAQHVEFTTLLAAEGV